MSNDNNKQEFSDKCLATMISGYTSLCLAVGQKLKLFQNLTEEPRSSEEIATSAGYKERYVREWLKSMVAGQFLEANEDGVLFFMKAYKKQVLTEQNTQMKFLMYIPMFAQVFDLLIDCFKLDGRSGIPYELYKDFHAVMANESDQSHHENLMDKFIPSIPGLIERLNSGTECLDVGCGRGTLSYLLGQKFPKSSFCGVDFAKDAIEFAQNRAQKEGLQNVHYFAFDCCKLPDDWSNKFHHVTTFDAVHDQAYPDKALREIFRVLQPGGLYSMVDVRCHSNVSMNVQPGGDFLYATSLFHCMPVSLYFPGGMGLGTGWGMEKAREMLMEAGFVDADFTLPGADSFNYHCLGKKPV